MEIFENLKYRFERATSEQQVIVLTLIIVIVVAPMLVALSKSLESPEPHTSTLTAKQVSITAEEADNLVRSAAVTRGKVVPIAPDTDCNARLSTIGSDVRILAETGIDRAVFTYGPAGVSPLPSLNGLPKAFDAACVNTVSESLKSRGFGVERVELSPAEGTGHLVVSWKPVATSK